MQVSIDEAKVSLSRLLEKVELGQESEIIIARAGHPVGKLIAAQGLETKRKLGTLRGKLVVPDFSSEDDVFLADEADSNRLFS